MFPAHNRVARFLAKLGMETGDRFYTLNRPVRALKELLDCDMGLGIDHPDFLDVHLPHEAPDSVDFDDVLGLADQVDMLGLGQVNAHHVIHQDIEMNGDHHKELGEHEDFYQPGPITFDVVLFGGDSPLGDVDQVKHLV